MSKAITGFYAYDDEQARSVYYAPGDEVPASVAAKVGDHCVDEKPDAGEVKVSVTEAELQDLVDARVAEAVGDKKYTQADLDEALAAAAEATREEFERLGALIAELRKDAEPGDGDGDQSNGDAGSEAGAPGADDKPEVKTSRSRTTK
jgi:hypothetical protein